jgi:raffinose/stachyose/melibiose transport system substrate-binding protein
MGGRFQRDNQSNRLRFDICFDRPNLWKEILVKKVTAIVFLVSVLLWPFVLYAVGQKEVQTNAETTELLLWTYEGEPRLSLLESLVEEFEAAHDGLTINVVSRDFGSYMTQVRLAMSGDSPPDIVGGVQGYSLTKDLIESELIIPLDEYATEYGWEERFPPSLLSQLRHTDDGSTWGDGALWGLAQFGELIGMFYNKQTLRDLEIGIPQTFESLLQSMEVAADSDVYPIALGNIQQYPGEFHVTAIVGQFAGPDFLRSIVYGDPAARWDTDEVVHALNTLQDWNDAGYFTPGYNSYDEDYAFEQVVKGNALYFITGPWYASSFAQELGEDAGFVLLPPRENTTLHTQGSLSQPYHISSSCQQPGLAVELIDFLTGSYAAEQIVAFGDLPAAIPDRDILEMDLESVQRQILDAWSDLLVNDGLVPFVGYSTPTIADVLYPGFQELIESRIGPEALSEELQEDRAAFFRSR